MNQLLNQCARFLSGGAVVLAGALAAGPAGAAELSSFNESRGYQACSDQAKRETRIVKMNDNYFIYDLDDSRRYYLNGYAYQDGASVPVKVACETTRNGNRLLSMSVDAGHYAGRIVDPVNVANN